VGPTMVGRSVAVVVVVGPAAMEGRKMTVVVLNEDQIKEFNKEKVDGVYGIDLKMLIEMRFKFGLFKIGHAKPEVRCDLKVPLKSHNDSSLGNGFQATDCDWVFQATDCESFYTLMLKKN